MLSEIKSGGLSRQSVWVSETLERFTGRATDLTWWVFEDEGAEFVSGVEHAAIPTGLTGSTDGLFLGIDMLGKKK